MILDRKIGKVELTDRTEETSRRTAAIISGAALLLMTIPAIFAAFVHGSVLVPGDAAATANNLLANAQQLRLALLSFLFVIILDLIVSWGLYVFFEPVNRTLSLLAGWTRLVYTAVFAAAIMNLGHALRLTQGTDVLEAGLLQAQAWLSLNAFGDGWDFALVLFSLHLILLGFLLFQGRNMPKILGILLVIAGLGYLFDSVAAILAPELGVTIGQFTFFGELLLAVWLLVKAASTRQWEKLTAESA